MKIDMIMFNGQNLRPIIFLDKYLKECRVLQIGGFGQRALTSCSAQQTIEFLNKQIFTFSVPAAALPI